MDILVWSTATARTIDGSDCGEPSSAVIITKLCSEYNSISRNADSINTTRNCKQNQSQFYLLSMCASIWLFVRGKTTRNTRDCLLMFANIFINRKTYTIFCIRLKVFNAYRRVIFHALITAIFPIVAAFFVTPLHEIISKNIFTSLHEYG